MIIYYGRDSNQRRILRSWVLRRRLLTVRSALIGICFLLATLCVYLTYRNREGVQIQPIYITDETKDAFLGHPMAVLNQLGFEKKSLADVSSWDLLWTFKYPFVPDFEVVKNLLPHQLVNHFPGTNLLASKRSLSTSGNTDVPPGFRIPRDVPKLLQYAEEHPEARFVQKSIHHRGIRIAALDELTLNNNKSFVQVFKENPLLIDGYKFDIGVYTILTSMDPLRVFIYDGDALLRFCVKKYHPFDPKIPEKYVVSDQLRPTWEIEPLRKYYVDLGLSMKASLNAHIESLGKDPSRIWSQIEDTTRRVFLKNEKDVMRSKWRYVSKRNYFELFRLDFFVAEDLDVHLMEVNMSPNLDSHLYPVSRQRYEQLLFNVFSLVNVGRRTRSNSLEIRSVEEREMQVFEKDLAVFPRECSSARCRAQCSPLICQLCKPCRNQETTQMLEEAFIEHQNRLSCKRLVPPIVYFEDANKSLSLDGLSRNNRIMHLWFQGKCLQDRSWCS